MSFFGVGTTNHSPQVICLSNLSPNSEPLTRIAKRLSERGIGFAYEFYSSRTGFGMVFEAKSTTVLVALDEEHPQTLMPMLGGTPVVYWLTRRVIQSATYYGTLPIAGPSVLRVHDGERLESFDEVIECLSLVSQPDAGIVQFPEPTPQVLITLRQHWDEILAIIHRDFSQIYDLDPRKFEELTAELVTRQGMRAELTKRTRDGGCDVLAYQESSMGNFLHLIECKRYALSRKVGADRVRSLHGILDPNRATSGIIVTTSEFTVPARDMEAMVSHRVVLHDYHYLKGWIERTLAR